MDFLTACKKTQSDFRHLETYISELDKNMRTKQTGIHTQEQEQSIDMKIDGIISVFTHTSNQIKEFLTVASAETRKMKQSGANKYVVDLRESHIASLGKKLSEILKHFQNVQYAFKQREKSRLKETYLIARPDATEAELEELDDPEKAEEMLNAAMSLGSTSCKNILIEARQRKDHIERIAEKINQLVELISEIDKLVQADANRVDQLVLNMEDAAENAENAEGELRRARVYQERRNWFARLFGSIFLVIFICLGLFVYGVFIKPLLS